MKLGGGIIYMAIDNSQNRENKDAELDGQNKSKHIKNQNEWIYLLNG